MNRINFRLPLVWTFVYGVCGAVIFATASGAGEAESQESVESIPETDKTENPYQAWHFAWGGANVYPGLSISEAYIDRSINTPLSLLFWDWERPTTFRTWRNHGMLWEPYAGVVRGLNRHFMLSLSGGAIAGTMKENSKNHLLLLPMETTIEFKRKAFYATVGLNYYPFERPDPENLSKRISLKRTFQNAKPYIAVGLTGMKLIEIGSAELKAPVLGRIFKKMQRFDYLFGHLTTRLGVELPLTPRNSITLSAGYAFCHPYSEEFSGVTLGIFHTYRF